MLHHKKNASNYLFSKQLKNLQSNQLIVGFISIIYSSQAVKTLPAATIHTLSAQPSLRIELGSLFTKLELEDVFRGIVKMQLRCKDTTFIRKKSSL